MIGIIYFFVIIFANAIGAISGMGGGVIIKPAFDLIGAHSVAAISFYSTVAVFTMSVVSTGRQIKTGAKFEWKMIGWVSLGSILGGILGNISFEFFLVLFHKDDYVQLLQIVVTILTLISTFLYTKYAWKSYAFHTYPLFLTCGLILGFLASLLGIGGGPINVALMMFLFSLPIKEATTYSICTIFFSQLAKLITMSVTSGFFRYDLNILVYIIPAAILGGLIGARFSRLLSPQKVTLIFQSVILFVIFINLFNACRLFT